MQEYTIVEEAIFKGTDAVVAQARSQAAQQVCYIQKIISLIEKANTLLAEFQDSWDDKYWEKYETAKGGYKPSQLAQKTVKQVEKQIEELKDLALYLRRVDREQQFDMYDDNSKVLSMVDEEAKKYKEATIKENDQKTRRDCCNQCNIL